jgi:hypothetical protein
VILFVAGVILILCAAGMQGGATLIVVATALDVTVPCWVTVLSVALTVELSVPVVAPLAAVTVNVMGALVAPGARPLILYEFSTEGVVKLPVLPVSVGIASVKVEAAHGAESLFVTLTVYCAVPPFVVI